MDEDEPPQDNMDNGSGSIPPNGSLARRFKSLRKLLGNRSICAVRAPVSIRCCVISKDIQG